MGEEIYDGRFMIDDVRTGNFQGLETRRPGFSRDWMVRSVPQEISRDCFQALEKMRRFFPRLGKVPSGCACFVALAAHGAE
jgi:hypothetical protein